MTIQFCFKEGKSKLACQGEQLSRGGHSRKNSGQDAVQPQGNRHKSMSRTNQLRRTTGTPMKEEIEVGLI